MFNLTLGTVLIMTLISGVGVEPVMAFAGIYLIIMSIVNLIAANERF